MVAVWISFAGLNLTVASAPVHFEPPVPVDEPVAFDAPALAVAREVVPALPIPVAEKMIEVVIPVSTQIQFSSRKEIEEFRFDIRWNRMAYPLEDYAPRTQTTSRIEGTIQVEEEQQNDSEFGLDLSTGSAGVVSGNAKALLGSRSAGNRSFSEIPQHEVLVASGTIQRGTGAFFRFHPSTTETLEGGRDLVVAWRVPRNWRGGLISIDCRATGARRILGSWTEPVESERSYVVAVYQDGDDQARQTATDFVRRELSLQDRVVQLASDSNPRPANRNPPFSPPLFRAPLLQPVNQQPELPANWAARLIHSGNDDLYLRYENRLPQSLKADALAFVEARRALVALSR